MTNENLNKAIQMARRIEELQRIEELLEIENFHSKKRETILTYAYKKGNNDYSVFPSWATNPILPLLAKHDAMIRQEIEPPYIENLSLYTMERFWQVRIMELTNGRIMKKLQNSLLIN